MKYFFTILMIVLLTFSGCTNESIIVETTPTPTENVTTDTNPTDLESTQAPEAKLTSDFEDAPTIVEIEDVANKEISAVLLQDMLEYQLPLNRHFAVALQEDSDQGYRWLLSSDDILYEYVEEIIVNGYRVFVFMAKSSGQTSIEFELTQDGSTLIDILNYQLNFT